MKKTVALTLFIVMGLFSKSQDYPNDYIQQRNVMVEQQIIARGVSDPSVISAMRKVERHKFVLPKNLNEAYNDYPLSIGAGQTISQPYIVAFMTEVLELDGQERILEIGTGSGYQAAVLAEICDSVYTIEIIEELGERAKLTLAELAYDNLAVKIGDGYKGWPEHAPYDAIIVTCSPTHVPEPLKEQLAEGGKMIIPVGATYAQELVLLQKQNGKLKQKSVLSVRFVPMIDGGGRKY